MSQIGNEIQQMLNDLKSETFLEPLDEENDLTHARIMSELGVSRTGAEYLADKMCRAGKWIKGYKRSKSGAKAAVYHPASE